MAKTKSDPIGFGRLEMPDDAGHAPEQERLQPTETELLPPLVEPLYVDDVTMDQFFQLYHLLPLTPVSKFEYQLVMICAALEQRVRELDPKA